jgi:uncharacterized membrane protein YdbT with pleckstrin-like domain
MAESGSLVPDEQVVLRLHPHWKTLIRPGLLLVVIVVAALALAIVVPYGRDAAIGQLVVGVAAVAAILACCVHPALRWWTTSYELTTRRLRLRRGILTRSGRDFPLSRISDVSFSHGLIDRLLGCGTLVVETAGEHGQLILTEIPHVQQVQDALFRLVQDEQERLAREG